MSHENNIYKEISLIFYMLTEKNFNNIITISLIIFLVFLAVITLKPIIFAIIYGVLLAYIFHPIYKWILKRVKNENLSALLVCFLLFLIILIPLILLLSALINQAIDFYLAFQNVDLTKIVQDITPQVIKDSGLSTILTESLNNFIPKIFSYVIAAISNAILNIPVFFLQLFVAIFVFFFSLRDGQKIKEYIRSLVPFTKETADKFYKQFKDITNSVLLGQVVVGLIQGLVAGLGYLIFGVPYVILLTILTMIMAIIPLIGAWLIWVPVDIYLFATGRSGPALGLLIYSLFIVSLIDNFLRTYIVSRKTEINPAIVVIGMIGGLFVFGFLGFIIGPLILGYIILMIEIYRKKKAEESIFLKEVKQIP